MAVALFGAAGLAWLVAVVSWVMALGHRAEGVTLGAMLTQGMKAFDPASFRESGQPHRRRFVKAFLVFMALIVAAVGVAVATTAAGGG